MDKNSSTDTAKFDNLVREMQEFGAEHLIAIGLKEDGKGGYDVRGFGTVQDKDFTCEVLRQMLASMEGS
ncbi:hypothetical protein [Pelagibius sp. Alg239-R121]|uniref:hypothetical protein n=1 Tax=Pelagibius sp. Alg239-R121 TaxID=2993448 RepID=UPI0024A6AFE1|nr:hypothetical protein [Pelagibius sp. Alg239-R121]